MMKPTLSILRACILKEKAIEYSPDGGRVQIRGKISQGWATIHVDDEGSGIPSDELPRIFERFYQMDKARSSRGVGLGLHISREIIRSHHGEILASSELGRGSRFTLQLPLARPDDSTLQSPVRKRRDPK